MAQNFVALEDFSELLWILVLLGAALSIQIRGSANLYILVESTLVLQQWANNLIKNLVLVNWCYIFQKSFH